MKTKEEIMAMSKDELIEYIDKALGIEVELIEKTTFPDLATIALCGQKETD